MAQRTERASLFASTFEAKWPRPDAESVSWKDPERMKSTSFRRKADVPSHSADNPVLRLDGVKK